MLHLLSIVSLLTSVVINSFLLTFASEISG
jgi:hypothetical protein